MKTLTNKNLGDILYAFVARATLDDLNTLLHYQTEMVRTNVLEGVRSQVDMVNSSVKAAQGVIDRMSEHDRNQLVNVIRLIVEG